MPKAVGDATAAVALHAQASDEVAQLGILSTVELGIDGAVAHLADIDVDTSAIASLVEATLRLRLDGDVETKGALVGGLLGAAVHIFNAH
jgi:hypothetical protein